MAELTAAARAARALLEHREAVARAVTGRLYAEMPWLQEKYGDRGREKCLQDVRYSLEHLVPAVELEAPDMFGRYAAWCDGVLRSRGVPTGELARSLELLADEAAGRLPADEAAAVAPCVDAGLRALGGGGAA
jgi:Phycobilisome protein